MAEPRSIRVPMKLEERTHWHYVMGGDDAIFVRDASGAIWSQGLARQGRLGRAEADILSSIPVPLGLVDGDGWRKP